MLFVCPAGWIGFLFTCLWNKATAEFQLLLDILPISHRPILLTACVTVNTQLLHSSYCAVLVLHYKLQQFHVGVIFNSFSSFSSFTCSSSSNIWGSAVQMSLFYCRWVPAAQPVFNSVHFCLTLGSFYCIWWNVFMLIIIFGLYVRIWWCHRWSQQRGERLKHLLTLLLLTRAVVFF